ncbi:MFS transporter [Polymorphobacter fuscus]|uniref:MFS transporter n=1 Tax=Sandarakinorhabdus fusca TaxID=1439888 RepID=A0A7C9KYI5_9SPHN|nr:MFS transporter [Polymorphobacter fuscus]KAB7647733.1 MFS transporter [Polymorphobacter fuscus]MQT17028.1 MFS transporter [Polymorphobacter fuscus]NJC08980.1 Na+/melibiose symporter-like transporter [Polymorphobacter fuscus]
MKISRGTLAAFAAPCLPIAANGLPVVVYLPPYYASALGLDLAVVGFLFFVVRFIDVPLDPIVGHLVDRTDTRAGRFRPWMAGGALVMALGVYATFMASPGLTPLRAFAGLMLMYLGYSALLVSHTAWGAVLSDDYHERSRIFGWWQASNLLGLFLILGVPPLAQKLAASDDPSFGVHAMGWTIMAALPLTVGWCLLRVRERARTGGEHHRFADIMAVLKLPLLRRILLADLLASLAPGMTGALFLFFFVAARGYSTASAMNLLLFYFAAGLLSAPLWVRVARRFSKHRALIWSLMAYCVFQTATIIIPGNQFGIAAVAMVFAGIPAVAPAFLLRAMLADVSDAETLRSGQQKTGLFYAALAAVQKLGYAIPVGLSYSILQLIGFVPNLGAANAPSAIDGLVLLFVVPAVVLAIGAIIVLRGWPIDADTQARNAAALAT